MSCYEASFFFSFIFLPWKATWRTSRQLSLQTPPFLAGLPNLPCPFSFCSAFYNRSRPCSPFEYSTIKTLTSLRAPYAVRRVTPSSGLWLAAGGQLTLTAQIDTLSIASDCEPLGAPYRPRAGYYNNDCSRNHLVVPSQRLWMKFSFFKKRNYIASRLPA